MLQKHSAPTSLQELVDQTAERIADTPREQLIADAPGLTHVERSISSQLKEIALDILDLLCLVILLYDRFKDGPTALNITAAAGLVGFFLANRVIKQKRATEQKRLSEAAKKATLRVGLACELCAGAEIFDPSNTDEDELQLVVTFDPELIATPERFEELTSKCAFALPFGEETGFSQQVHPELAKAGSAWSSSTDSQPVSLPKAATEGTDACFANSMFYPSLSPKGYVDRMFWPVILTDIPGRENIAVQIPSSYWYSEAVDELPISFGFMADAYAKMQAAAGMET